MITMRGSKKENFISRGETDEHGRTEASGRGNQTYMLFGCKFREHEAGEEQAEDRMMEY